VAAAPAVAGPPIPVRLHEGKAHNEGVLKPVQVFHQGRWLSATLLVTRRDADGWHGLVGYSDPITREGFYHWCPAAQLRSAADPADPR
jgi:hypothetical protein